MTITEIYLQSGHVQKKIVRFYMGNRFDNRQVNNFIVNQGVASTCKNKFLLFIKIRSITAQLQFARLQFAQL